jgi:hypothetical protein
MRRIFTAITILMFWASLASAATVFSNGFESGNLSDWGIDQGAEVTTGEVHDGRYALKMTAVDGGGQYLYSPETLDLSTAYARFYLYVDNANTKGFTGVFVMGPAEARLYFDGLGDVSLGVWNGYANYQVGGWTPLTPRTWYLVELKTVVSPTEGVIEEKLNGAVIATGANLDTGIDKVTFISPENFTRGDTPDVDVYQDDLAVSDSAYVGATETDGASTTAPK